MFNEPSTVILPLTSKPPLTSMLFKTVVLPIVKSPVMAVVPYNVKLEMMSKLLAKIVG